MQASGTCNDRTTSNNLTISTPDSANQPLAASATFVTQFVWSCNYWNCRWCHWSVTHFVIHHRRLFGFSGISLQTRLYTQPQPHSCRSPARLHHSLRSRRHLIIFTLTIFQHFQASSVFFLSTETETKPLMVKNGKSRALKMIKCHLDNKLNWTELSCSFA